jgi:hypothetical protein
VPPLATGTAGHPAAATDRISLEERLLAIDAAIAFLHPLTERNRPALDEVRAGLGQIRAASSQGSAALEAAAAAAEAAILKVDAQVPTSSFRLASLAALPPAQVARYAGLLGRHAAGSLQRLDRVELLVTRLCTREEPGGAWALLSRAEVDDLLRLAGRGPAGNSARAVSFFAAASQRAATLAAVNDAFESGLYLDTRGYKISLKEERLAPDALYAAASFNIAFQRRVHELQSAEGVAEPALAGRFRNAEEQIELLFGKTVLGGLEEPPPPAHEERARTAPIVLLERRRVPLRTWLRAGGIAFAVAGAVLVFARGRGDGKLVEIPKAELSRFSPLLESASLSKGPDSFLLGRIPAGRWMLLSRSERRMAASDLRNRLMRRKIGAAVVFRDDDVLAIQIEQGRVLAVE